MKAGLKNRKWKSAIHRVPKKFCHLFMWFLLIILLSVTKKLPIESKCFFWNNRIPPLNIHNFDKLSLWLNIWKILHTYTGFVAFFFHIHTGICMYTYIYIQKYFPNVYMYTHIDVYMYIYLYMCVHMCAHTHMYRDIHIYIYPFWTISWNQYNFEGFWAFQWKQVTGIMG